MKFNMIRPTKFKLLRVFQLFCFLFILSCNQNSLELKAELINQADVKKKIIDTIFSLPEVKQRAAFIFNQTNGGRSMKVWIEDTPSISAKEYYWVKAGEDNGIKLVTHYNFFVYPESMKIMLYDSKTNKELPLERWRNSNY